MRSSVEDEVALSRLISNISRAVYKSGLRRKGLQTGKNCIFTTMGINSHQITMHFELRPHKNCGHGLRIYLTTEDRKSPEIKIPEIPIGYHPSIKNITIDWLEKKILRALRKIKIRKKATE